MWQEKIVLIIERQDTANHAEYGPILAHMGPLFAESVPKTRPTSVPGGDGWVPNRPQRRVYRRLTPRPLFFGALGGRTAGDALRMVERTQCIKRSESSSTFRVGMNFSTITCHFTNGTI